MASTKTDYQVASLAAGFTLGFGFLTVWEALKQTRNNKNPLRSSYIYMVWGEIVANLAIGIIGWLFLDGIVGPTVPVLFFILFLWVFEVQLLMQIIINRIAIIHESYKTIRWLKWGTVGIITIIEVLVFCIWIPSHTVPPASATFVAINDYWDKVSKVLILIVDAGLNWYFLHIVKKRLLQHHGLMKYKPLVSFNAKLMVVSILMDLMLIGLMFLPNQVVYVQFHPVAYMVKLNIEMSMASLITRLAKSKNNDVSMHSYSETDRRRNYGTDENAHMSRGPENGLQPFSRSRIQSSRNDTDTGHGGIQKTFDFNVTVQSARAGETAHKDHAVMFDKMDEEEEISLTSYPGHPHSSAKSLDDRSVSISQKS